MLAYTGLLASPGGSELIEAVASHSSLCKLTVVRPDGVGEPLRKGHCALIGSAIVRNRNLAALHLRRCGLWTDSLSALVPPAVRDDDERQRDAHPRAPRAAAWIASPRLASPCLASPPPPRPSPSQMAPNITRLK